MGQGLLRDAKASCGGPSISHLLFADDCILFGKANVNWATTLRTILQEYEACSRQCINFDKSSIFYSSNTLSSDRRGVESILGIRFFADIEKYLGLPTFVGKWKKVAFLSLKKRFHKKVNGWKYLLNRFYRLCQPIPWLVFYSQRLYVMIWRKLRGDFGGKKGAVRKGFIGVSGVIYVFLKSIGVGGFVGLHILIKLFWPNNVGEFLLPLILYYL